MDKKLRILITGANGYVAKSLYVALKDIHDVVAITRKEVDLTNFDDVNSFFKKTGGFNVIIHCAVKGGSRLHHDEWEVLDENLKMYYNLLSNKCYFQKFIHFGSGAELYMKNEPYGFSKDVIRKSMLTKNYFYNLRIFAVFDENELDTRFIKANIKRYINKEPIQIYQNKYMDFIYMKDLITLVKYYILNNNTPKEINCNYFTSFNLLDIANIINSLDDYKVDINIQQKESGESYKDSYIDLGIKFLGLEQGIKEIYNLIKNSK
jgi:GDP-L-fucose synthase